MNAFKLHIIKFLLSFTFFYLEFIQTSWAQTSKLIDGFRYNHYFTAIIFGKGTVKDTIIREPSDFQNRKLKINYQFDQFPNSQFSITCNYGKFTQDYSFVPVKFTLNIKGGNPNDQLRLRLWEDIDMNGKFDGKDEVFESLPFTLGDTTEHQLSFPINSFIKVEGNGNNLLDLNRIRAWDVMVENNTEKAHTGVLYIDNLKFYTSYTPEYSKNASLTGTFITLCNTAICKNDSWTFSQWKEELQKMKSMNLDKLIIQYSIHQNIGWYSPCKLPFVAHSDSTINTIFKAAEVTGMKVYLGLSFDEMWYKSDKASANVYNDLLLKQKGTIDELNSLFGKNNVFCGWYIPQEINDFDWQTEDKKNLLFKWLQDLAMYAHSKNRAKTVMISPFFNLWQPADVLGNWYDDLLNRATDIDWVYMQDGIGSTLKDIDVDIPHYYGFIKSACDKHGKKFGAVVESFHQLTGWPVNNEIFTAIPASIKRVNAQVQEAYHQKPNDIIMFEWNYLPKK